MRYAVIGNGKIFNIVEATPEVANENGWVECPNEADIGWEVDAHGKFSPPKPDLETLSFMVRAERDRLLQSTDWTQGADIPTTIKSAYKPYRQALRDVPLQEGFPYNIIWPTKPE